MMTHNKSELLKTINKLGFPDKEVVLALDTFFEANEEYGSIGVNIYPNQPSPQIFYDAFKELRDLKKADNIFVRVTDTEDPEDWFYSDTIYVIGNLTLEELETSIKHLHFDEIYKGWMYGEPVNIGQYDKTKNIFSVWWD